MRKAKAAGLPRKLKASACVRRKAIECHLAGDHDLGRDRSLGRASLLAFEVLDQLQRIPITAMMPSTINRIFNPAPLLAAGARG